ncbi:hypothetical protein K503DRAFT_702329 [Rhizopogon vinicolor AM-OR11-026]|uniref:Ribosomal RNA-processing protein 43 n=1 Tax=Rhizopogon vinicolor AM-OR11-026 TaxID=1314800 RepID=A0A1B7MI16_9AGAM|nr:hypothetical protein K503DRAFT_702329 [Rhizopogon vinicolor AM-OR11-026]
MLLHAAESTYTANGSALLLRDTTVVCGIKAEIVAPDLDLPEDDSFELHVTPNVDLPVICSPK